MDFPEELKGMFLNSKRINVYLSDIPIHISKYNLVVFCNLATMDEQR